MKKDSRGYYGDSHILVVNMGLWAKIEARKCACPLCEKGNCFVYIILRPKTSQQMDAKDICLEWTMASGRCPQPHCADHLHGVPCNFCRRPFLSDSRHQDIGPRPIFDTPYYYYYYYTVQSLACSHFSQWSHPSVFGHCSLLHAQSISCVDATGHGLSL